MRIGIDCRTILNPGKGEQAGVGHYTYSLVTHLLRQDKVNEYVLFFDWRVTKRETREFAKKNVKIKFFPFSQYKKYLPFTYSHMLISAVLLRERLDLFHAPANTMPITYPGDTVLTVHDLAIYRHPSWFPRGQKFSTKILVPRSVKKAKRIIVVSNATKRDVAELFKIKSDKMRVISEGVVHPTGVTRSVTKEVLEKKYRLSPSYLVFVGTLEPRKNLVSLIKAFNELLVHDYRKFKDYELVIAGAKGWKYEEIFETIKTIKFGYKVKFLNYIPHDDKIALMKFATCFVFPSKYEGFGLPVLEAMSLGTPVITSTTSSLPEVCGKAALLINPNRIREMTKAMERVLQDRRLRDRMREMGKIQAQKFTWRDAARATIKIYREVHELKKGRRKG